METQQMMELLLATFNASMKEHKQDILARMEADRKAEKEKAEANREELKEMMKAMQEDIKSGQAEMRPTVSDIRSELKETLRLMRTATGPIWSELDETTACHEATETEPDPRSMQSVEEHQEIPKEDAAVMLVRGLNKRRSDLNLAAGA
jgi:hypothetical protein